MKITRGKLRRERIEVAAMEFPVASAVALIRAIEKPSRNLKRVLDQITDLDSRRLKTRMKGNFGDQEFVNQAIRLASELQDIEGEI